ncbi:hypothetical protein J5868_00915 [Candidatus Saccharibacteria bacterium]|nr:hypothetical protein [Candidatus Saccharibacteria bacterium]
MNTKKTVADKERQYKIVYGPSKDALFDACKYAHDKHSHVSVQFSIEIGYTLPPEKSEAAYILKTIKNIKLNGIEHEDGSGESFSLYGYCITNLGSSGTESKDESYGFTAHYNARTRNGFITFR